jgi:hypothetical protein
MHNGGTVPIQDVRGAGSVDACLSIERIPTYFINET